MEENNLDSNKDKKVFNEIEADAPKLFLEEKLIQTTTSTCG